MEFSFGDHVLDPDRREQRRGTEPVALEPQVFDLLIYLLQNRDRVVSKDDLLAAVWGGRIVSESTLTSRISAVRRAVGDSGEVQRLIRTIPRKDIRFIGVVETGRNPAAPSRTPPILPDKPSIAVLPFANIAGDPEQEYFADGMVEEIITALSRIRWLFVIARNSSFTYKGRAVNVKQVGQDLNVRYVLEGSVRKAGQRIRISAQLIEAASGAHLWADRRGLGRPMGRDRFCRARMDGPGQAHESRQGAPGAAIGRRNGGDRGDVGDPRRRACLSRPQWHARAAGDAADPRRDQRRDQRARLSQHLPRLGFGDHRISQRGHRDGARPHDQEPVGGRLLARRFVREAAGADARLGAAVRGWRRGCAAPARP